MQYRAAPSCQSPKIQFVEDGGQFRAAEPALTKLAFSPI